MPRATLQPAVVPLDPQHAVAALRDAGPGENRIQWSETRDAGQSWVQKSPRESLLGLVIMATGIPFYLHWKRKLAA